MTDSDLRLAPREPVTPERAGWRYLSFSVHDVAGPMEVGGEGRETEIGRAHV